LAEMVSVIDGLIMRALSDKYASIFPSCVNELYFSMSGNLHQSGDCFFHN
jgi:hypothetical protein